MIVGNRSDCVIPNKLESWLTAAETKGSILSRVMNLEKPDLLVFESLLRTVQLRLWHLSRRARSRFIPAGGLLAVVKT